MAPVVDLATFDPPEEDHRRTKRVFRYILHIVHLSVALLFLAALIVDLISRGRTLFILYLVPLIIITIITEICHLCRRPPPERLTSRLGVFNTLRGRGFIYQVAAALVIVHGDHSYSRGGWCRYHDSLLEVVGILGWVAWGDGVALFALAVLAREFGFEDWVEEPTKPSIRLEESDIEDAALVHALDHSS